MPKVLEYRGTVASEGLFAGPVALFDGRKHERRRVGSPQAEHLALIAAIDKAVEQIARIMESADDTAKSILEFQIAMLEDSALSEPALTAISKGSAADLAWRATLDTEIFGYEQSADEYFSARSADLKDIRDRVLHALTEDLSEISIQGAVLFGEDLPPSRFLEVDWSKGGAIALTRGSTTSHVATLARSKGVPMVVGLGEAQPKENALVDALEGRVIFDPPQALRAEFEARQMHYEAEKLEEASFLLKPARRRHGSAVELLINVASIEELDFLDPNSCDGIGLMRSEFLFVDGKPLPDEDRQYEAYRRLLEWAAGRPVTVRTLDVGGDKPVAGLTVEGERNPFLGRRGVRLTLAKPDVFRVQLRALARAAVHGPLKVMVPMVTVPRELAEVDALLTQCIAELGGKEIVCRRPQLGIMVEVPAVAIAPELFRAADFFSIGTNDLTQYVTATSRDEASVASLSDPSHPALLKLIASVVVFARSAGIPVSLCGDMASDTNHLKALLEAGLTSLSVAPSRIARVKRALSGL